MPIAPRPGRKGGKISSSPAVAAAENSPSTVSPGTLPPGGIASLLPSDPNSVLEFDLDALMSNKRTSTSARDKKSSSPAVAPVPTPPTSDTNAFKFDLDVIQQVGQGVVMGGNKTVRTDSHLPEAKLSDVIEKLTDVLAAQKAEAVQPLTDKVLPGLEDAVEKEVVIVPRPQLALQLAVAVSTTVPGAKVLVVVPQFYEVATVAQDLRQLRDVRGGPAEGVGELCGQSFSGEESCRLWVTNAETALVYLHAQKSLSPFTHVVLPGLSRMTPLTSYFLWGLRERVFRHSPNLDATAPPLHVIACASEGNAHDMEEFFSQQSPLVITTPVKPTTEFTYDESTALAETTVLEIEVDRTGRYPGPHRKLVDHVVRVAVQVTKKILAAATSPQSILVFTADTREVADALLAANLSNTMVQFARLSPEEVSTSMHRVVVMHHVLGIPEAVEEFDRVTCVLDLGTIRCLSQQNKSESFLVASSSEWASKPEVELRKAVLGVVYPGAYFALYPPAAEAVFPAKDTRRPAVYGVEDALLQCARAEMPVGLVRDALVQTDAETMEQVMHNLAEKCLIVSPVDLGITFLGEMATRMPLEIDLAHFVINGCTVGLAEAAVVIGCVSALSFRLPSGHFSNAAEEMRWRERVLESRRKYAGDIARQSDLLADTLAFVEWCRLRAANASTQSLLEDLQARETRMEQIKVLMDHLRMQLSDYTFFDNLDDPVVLGQVAESIKTNATVLTFLEAVSLARRVSFVRDAGNLNPRDRSAALVFVRTSKKVMANQHTPSLVPWDMGAALVAVDLRNFSTTIAVSRLSIMSTSYLFAALLLLYPQIEYSAPAELPGRGQVVFFGVTCNRQMKRFRVSIVEAAHILDFREKWCQALGYLQALRTSRRPLSHRRFALELKEKDRTFDLERFRSDLQRELLTLVTEIEATEHQGSFTTQAVHCLAPKSVLTPCPDAEASDIVITKKFREGELWTVASSRNESPATVQAAQQSQQASPTSNFPTITPYEEDDDDIEVIEESYFLKHGPIIDDDDDEE